MNILIVAPRGKQAGLATLAAANREDVKIVGAVAPKGRDYIGMDVGEVSPIGRKVGAKVYGDIEEIIDECDAIVDFSTIESSLAVLEAARSHGKAYVCGTTGFSDEQKNKFAEASKDIPVMLTANTSKLVNVLYKMLEMTARSVGKDTDIEIVDMHDNHKLDAPSGTAREIGNAIGRGLGKNIDEIAEYGHCGEDPRTDGSVVFHSIRGGDWPSSHTVYFIGNGERLELTHHSLNWKCFGEGAVDAAIFLCGQKPGQYTMADVLGLN